MASNSGDKTDPMATTSTTDFATSDIAADKAEIPTPNIRQHPAFRDNRTDTPVGGTIAGPSSGSTTSDPSHSSGNGSASGTASAVSYNGPKIEDDSVGGIHNMNDFKLPGGYWSHDKAAVMKATAEQNRNPQNRNNSYEASVDGKGLHISSSPKSSQEAAPKSESKPNSTSADKTKSQDGKAEAATEEANGKGKGLFDEEKKGGVLRKLLGRKD